LSRAASRNEGVGNGKTGDETFLLISQGFSVTSSTPSRGPIVQTET